MIAMAHIIGAPSNVRTKKLILCRNQPSPLLSCQKSGLLKKAAKIILPWFSLGLRVFGLGVTPEARLIYKCTRLDDMLHGHGNAQGLLK